MRSKKQLLGIRTNAVSRNRLDIPLGVGAAAIGRITHWVIRTMVRQSNS